MNAYGYECKVTREMLEDGVAEVYVKQRVRGDCQAKAPSAHRVSPERIKVADDVRRFEVEVRPGEFWPLEMCKAAEWQGICGGTSNAYVVYAEVEYQVLEP